VTSPIDKVLARWTEARKVSQNSWRGPCPCCGGSKRSGKAAVTETSSGAVIAHCFACGANGLQIVEALGLEPSDLYPPREAVLAREAAGKRSDRLDAYTGLRLIASEAIESARLILVMGMHDMTDSRRERLMESARSIALTLRACGLREIR